MSIVLPRVERLTNDQTPQVAAVVVVVKSFKIRACGRLAACGFLAAFWAGAAEVAAFTMQLLIYNVNLEQIYSLCLKSEDNDFNTLMVPVL